MSECQVYFDPRRLIHMLGVTLLQESRILPGWARVKDSSRCLTDLLLCCGLSLPAALLPQLRFSLPGCRHGFHVRLVGSPRLGPEPFQDLSTSTVLTVLLSAGAKPVAWAVRRRWGEHHG